jgi:ATP-dependent HslUV protease subunit HslV
MTVIAYRDGVMAADTLGSDSVLKVSGMRKIARGPDGTLYGCGGRASICCDFLRWVDGGCDGDRPALKRDDDTADVLVARPDGSVSIWTWAGDEDYPGCEYLSIGSGSAVAMGAMFMGALAEDSVRAGIEHGIGCGGTVMVVRR